MGARGWRLRRPHPRGRRRPYLLGELLVVLVLIRVYDIVKALADQKAATGLHDARLVRRLEVTLHLDIEHSLNRQLVGHHVLSVLCSYWYQYAHEGITLTVLALCWWLRPTAYRAARNALVAINVVGLTVFALFPVAPPRLLPGAGFTDTVAAAGFGSDHGGVVHVDQFAAMPSLHVAWAVWTAVLVSCWVRRPVLRGLCLAYPLVMTYVVLATANHYVLDAVAGAVTTAGCAALTGMVGPGVPGLLARRRARRSVRQGRLAAAELPGGDQDDREADRQHHEV